MAMKPVYLQSDNLITSVGFDTASHRTALEAGRIGIRLVDDPLLYPKPVMLSCIDSAELEARFESVLNEYRKEAPATAYTRLEKLFIVSIGAVLRENPRIATDPRTLLVISTTKGNINLLEDRYKLVFDHRRLYLWELGRIIGRFFGFVNTPVMISNACISGLVAIMTAMRHLRTGRWDHAVVAGGDIVSEFVISGFQSFQAISPEPCKPFDLNRTGLSLGEGCGAIVLTTDRARAGLVPVVAAGAATSNDANHISGPSRTGEELGWAIRQAMLEAGTAPRELGYISAHGTATPFNDEMESKAIGFAGLEQVPVNSFKGYWGHTLGAAGIVETVMAVDSLRQGFLYRSAGFSEPGVPLPLNVITENHPQAFDACLKTASGFGGCNAAIVYRKD